MKFLELFQPAVAPTLRKDIPDPPFGWTPVLPKEAAHV